jgi:hypothetical protein
MTVPELSQKVGLSQNSWQGDSAKSFEFSTALIRELPFHPLDRLRKKQVR